jgi:hypothetical protein
VLGARTRCRHAAVAGAAGGAHGEQGGGRVNTALAARAHLFLPSRVELLVHFGAQTFELAPKRSVRPGVQ